jgi:RNA polymerase sigma-70 factor (ECF subfamily)
MSVEAGSTALDRPTIPAEKDKDLVARAQRGEEPAFAALFEAHKRRVYALCLRMTANTADAEELTQEAFLQVFRKIATFRGESAFSTWLHRLTVNVVFMRLRRKRIAQVSLDETDAGYEEPLQREHGDEDRRLAACIDRISLDRAITLLPPGHRTVFVLYELEGRAHNEIAKILNCSVGNSKALLHRARTKLRGWLGVPKLDGEYARG